MAELITIGNITTVNIVFVIILTGLQCFDAVGRATGRASGL